MGLGNFKDSNAKGLIPPKQGSGFGSKTDATKKGGGFGGIVDKYIAQGYQYKEGDINAKVLKFELNTDSNTPTQNPTAPIEQVTTVQSEQVLNIPNPNPNGDLQTKDADKGVENPSQGEEQGTAKLPNIDVPQTFFQKNKTSILIGSGVVVVAVIGLIVFSVMSSKK